MEQTIIKYRRLELEKLKQTESFHSIVKIYSQMNDELENNIQEIKENKKLFTFQQKLKIKLNYPISSISINMDKK